MAKLFCSFKKNVLVYNFYSTPRFIATSYAHGRLCRRKHLPPVSRTEHQRNLVQNQDPLGFFSCPTLFYTSGKWSEDLDRLNWSTHLSELDQDHFSDGSRAEVKAVSGCPPPSCDEQILIDFTGIYTGEMSLQILQPAGHQDMSLMGICSPSPDVWL